MFIKNILRFFSKMFHPHHIIAFSFYPFLVSVFLSYNFFFFSIFLNCGFIYFYNFYSIYFYINFFLFILTLIFWWGEMIEESIIFGHNTKNVNLNFFFGMVLFIVSEVMFFFAFFWAFFHYSLNPSYMIGCCWPPFGINIVNYSILPFINTLLLLSSGITVTWSHISLKKKNSLILVKYLKSVNYLKNELNVHLLFSLSMTIFFSLIFLHIQFIEFKYTLFTISDSVYGTIFFSITGLHSLHVFIGTVFLIVSFFRFLLEMVNSDKSSLFEFSVWYWHFVDIVWLFVMLFVYVWGS